MSPEKPFTVLFLCTGNSARSIFGEFLLRDLGKGAFGTQSAGSHPRGVVNPYTQRVLREVYGIDASKALSKSLDSFRGQSFDFVITVCDHAQESCPIWPGKTVVAHWGSPDPASFRGSEAETFDYFKKVAAQIYRRAARLCGLPLTSLNQDQRRQVLQEIGGLE